jgi:SnoaL-like protein
MGISGLPGVPSGPAMPMTLQAFDDWLHSYGRAWESRNPQAAADLFAEDGSYQVTPFLEPMRGKPAILEYWTHVALDPARHSIWIRNSCPNSRARNRPVVGFLRYCSARPQHQARRHFPHLPRQKCPLPFPPRVVAQTTRLIARILTHSMKLANKVIDRRSLHLFTCPS